MKRKMTDQEIEVALDETRATLEMEKKAAELKIEKAIRSAKGSLAIEGLFPSKEAEAIVKQHLEGNITEAMAIKKILDNLGISNN